MRSCVHICTMHDLLHSGHHLPTRNLVVLPRATSDLMLTSPIFKAYSLWLNLGHNLKSSNLDSERRVPSVVCRAFGEVNVVTVYST